ncbi:MAG: tRNA-dihydrouridine synthase [Methanobacteriaceae archaeon]|nr:tRNA-dihydrouridine synthase [Methanobacteriaceae archaeon]
MAGITDSDFLIKVIPYGFDMVTLGGYNLDDETLNAAKLVSKRGRKEFIIPIYKIYEYICFESFRVKNFNSEVLISANLRSLNPENIVKLSKINSLDVVEINCHCRQKEFIDIGCGQEMLKRDDLEEFISYVTNNASSKVSVKIRGNVLGVNTLEIADLISSCGVDYLHVDAMNPEVDDADFDLLNSLANELDTFIIGNNSVNSEAQVSKMLETGVNGFSIGRAIIDGNLDFQI